MFQEITKDNWLLFAQHNYDKPILNSEQEFYDDLKRFKYLKRLFRKYKITGDIKVRLAVNHMIVLQNVFGVEAAVTLLLYKVDKDYWSFLKTILDYLFMNILKLFQIFFKKIIDIYKMSLKNC